MKSFVKQHLLTPHPRKWGRGSVARDIVLLRFMPGVILRTAQYAIPRSRLRTDKKNNLVKSRLTSHESRHGHFTALVRL